MQAQVILGVKAGLAEDLLGLPTPSGGRSYAGADGAAIGLQTNQLDLQPSILIPAIIAEQRRGLVHVHDEHIDIAIVVEVAECAAPARMTRRDAWPAAVTDVFEHAVSKIPQNQTRISVFVFLEELLQLGIDVAV